MRRRGRARARSAAATRGLAIEDPEGPLEWLAKDRALVTFDGETHLRAKRRALVAILRQWIRAVASGG